MLYGSQQNCTEMLPCDRSHQFTGAFVTTQKCQSMIAPTYSREVEHHSQKCQGSHAFQGKGHHGPAEMPFMVHPSRPVYGSQPSVAAMPLQIRSQGKGHHRIAEMPSTGTPFPTSLWATYRSQQCHFLNAHQLGKDITFTLIKPPLFLSFLLIYGRVRRDPQQCHGDCTLPPVRKGHNLYANQAATVSPFPINLWGLFTWRIYAKQSSPPPVLSHIETAEMPMPRRPILTRGQQRSAEMPRHTRLATKEIQYG